MPPRQRETFPLSSLLGFDPQLFCSAQWPDFVSTAQDGGVADWPQGGRKFEVVTGHPCGG
jgi:hypothetical protein